MSSSPVRPGFSAGDWSADDAFEQTKMIVVESAQWTASKSYLAWSKTTRRVRAVGGFIIFTLVALSLWRPDQYELPMVSVQYGGGHASSPFNVSKVALLIENRPNPILAPLMLHFMSVIPPDWRFRFMGSLESVADLNSSLAIRNQVEIGKLDLTYIPSNMSTAGQEMISRFLTNRWLYEQVLQPAEWLLVFQTDSILCANSNRSLNDWLDYDWVGAPWSVNSKFGGNGGLSLRRVSAIVDVLRNQERQFGSEAEDVWLSERLGNRPGARMANGTISLTFSGEMYSGDPTKIKHEKAKGKTNTEKKPAGGGIDSVAQDEGWEGGIDDWRDGFYEPMGYHTGDSGKTLHSGIWGTPAFRKHIWDYCPEVKMIFNMDAAEYVPGDCNSNWKRDEGMIGDANHEMGRAWERDVDENGYPYLPANLVPW